MATVRDIFTQMDQWAPFETQMDFDNAGFLVGRGEREVRKILVSLDITEPVADEAADWGADLIVAHHPVIFHPVKRLTDETPTGRTLLALAERGIAAICAHTNLDAAEGGVNTQLALGVGLTDTVPLEPMGEDEAGRPYGIGRVGKLPDGPLSLAAFAQRVKEGLHLDGLRAMDAGRPVEKVAVGGGACGSMLPLVQAMGCDTFVTSDLKHDLYLEARALGINLLDAGHYSTEAVVCPALAAWAKEAFPAVEVLLAERQGEVFQYL